MFGRVELEADCQNERHMGQPQCHELLCLSYTYRKRIRYWEPYIRSALQDTVVDVAFDRQIFQDSF